MLASFASLLKTKSDLFPMAGSGSTTKSSISPVLPLPSLPSEAPIPISHPILSFHPPSSSFSSEHHFYVDTKANPPRSIWTHPFDDPTFIEAIPDSDRDQHTSSDLPSSHSHGRQQQHQPQQAQHESSTTDGPSSRAQLLANQSGKHEKVSFGDKVKEKLTGKTKEERATKRSEKAAAERVRFLFRFFSPLPFSRLLKLTGLTKTSCRPSILAGRT